MTRLVIHAGTHATDARAICGQLASWRGRLDTLGVRLHPDAPEAWADDIRALADDEAPPALVETAHRALRDGKTMLLLSSERLEDSLREAADIASLEAFGRAVGMGVTVLCVLRDQLGYLNELYCDRVIRLQTAKSFASFAAAPDPARRFDYGKAFDVVLGGDELGFVAVPYDQMQDGTQGRTLLEAAGVPSAATASLPAGSTREPLPGPVLVAACRLLFKRAWRLGMFNRLPRGRLLDAVATLRRRSDEQAWDDAPFWGWSEPLRQVAIARYQPGNDVLASALWGRSWGDSWESGRYVDLDLAASSSALVVDVLLTIDGLIKDLKAEKTEKAALTAENAGA
ncbi:MAG: hypothetical protein QOI51_699 [Nocardioidaceae bacterium]|nr:hypothetical protein [Nocardioidaceae bacterium]